MQLAAHRHQALDPAIGAMGDAPRQMGGCHLADVVAAQAQPFLTQSEGQHAAHIVLGAFGQRC